MIEELLAKVDKSPQAINKEMVVRAYNLASKAHAGQKRLSGEPYVVHPIEVAGILVEIGLDTNTIAAALLHDVVEDTDYTYEDIKLEFGDTVAELVEGVTKLGKIQYKSREEEQADNVRKMVLAMSKDIRVVLIKLADRLHNMRTLRFKGAEKQKEKAKEVFDVYAPLAHRLGMFRIKWELEDLAFRYLHPDEYYDLVDQIAEKRAEREEYIARIKAEIVDRLSSSGIDCDIDGRPKHLYSIYRKMNNKMKTLDQIFDLTAIRVIVDSIKDCYAVLGIVHTIYKPMPGRFKDYIAMPKPNMYQSLHTTVIGPLGKPFEIQIRTYEMHTIAEYGIAAHWNYKEGNSNTVDQRYAWLRDMLEWERDTEDADEFMESFKVDLFEDEVFVFTPKGKVINLPAEATPIDFAYRIHTDVGNKTVGARVNGAQVSLDTRLKTGEIVEIITSNSNKGPSIHWLNVAKSNHAKAKIRSWFKKEKREENIARGKDLLEKEAKRQDCNFADIAKGVGLHNIINKYHGNSIEDLYVVVGSSQVPPAFVVDFLQAAMRPVESNGKTTSTLEEDLADATALVAKAKKKAAEKRKRKPKNFFGVTVTGMNNVEVRFAKCCNPLPGDDIQGYITNFRGISVHRQDCSNLQELLTKEDPSRFVQVDWTSSSDELYSARVRIVAVDRPSLLGDVLLVINELHIAMNAVNAETTSHGRSIVELSLLVGDNHLLDEVMKRLRKISDVEDVSRIGS